MPDEEAVEILEFHIEEYKSLRAMRVPWSAQTVLYGQNGVGKTNLLEAIALCFGSEATLWQVAARAVEPKAGAISALVRSTAAELPLAPAYCIPSGGTLSDAPAGTNTIIDSARFWMMLEADAASGRTWQEAVGRVVPHDDLAALLARAAERPLVRFGLEGVEDLREARAMDRGLWMRDEWAGGDPTGVSFGRRYSRTLAIEGPVPEWLAEMAPTLPHLFSPLRRWLAESSGSRSAYPDLLELPPTRWAPIRAVWLASERTASEAWFDLSRAYDRAEPAVVALGLQLDRLRFAAVDADAEEPDDHPDARFWLVASAAESAAASLSSVFPNLEAIAEDAHAAAIDFYRSPSLTREHFIGRVDDPHLFDSLSSGERTWMDLALAHASARLESIATTTQWVQIGVQRLSDEALLEAAVELESNLAVFTEGYWNTDDLTRATAYMQRLLGSAEEVLAGDVAHDEDTRALLRAVYADVMPAVREALRPTLLLHLYDEPERHLHPDAQRRVQRLLSAPTGADVALATHSHLFLGGPGWRHLHIGASPEGSVLTAFDPAALDLASAVTQQMGLTRGELLTRVRYVLFVEGPVDVLVLRALYGQLLDEAGVLLLPIHGVEEVASLAELELFGRIVDVGAGLLVDHAQTKRLRSGRLSAHPTKEEQAVHDLRKRLKRRGRSFDFFGLEREDIIAYLDENAIKAEAPAFPGWHLVAVERERNEKLKDAAARLAGVHFGRRLVDRIAQRMATEQIAALGDLSYRVADVVAASGQ